MGEVSDKAKKLAKRYGDVLQKADQNGGSGTTKGDGKTTVQELNEYHDQLQVEFFSKAEFLAHVVENKDNFPAGRDEEIRGELREQNKEIDALRETIGFFDRHYLQDVGTEQEYEQRFKNGSLTREEVLEILSGDANLSYHVPKAEAIFRNIDGVRVGGIIITDEEKSDGKEFVSKLDSNKDGKVDVAEYIEGKGDELKVKRIGEIKAKEFEKATKELEQKSKESEPLNPDRTASVSTPATAIYADNIAANEALGKA